MAEAPKPTANGSLKPWPSWRQRFRSFRRAERSAAGHGGLADLYQVAIRILDVGADLPAVVLRLGQEMSSLRRPFPINLGDVGDAHVEKGARSIRIRWRRERDRRLVVSRSTAAVENQPAVGHLHNHGVALDQHLPVEQFLVEVARSILVGDDEEVGEDEAVLGGGKVVGIDRHWDFLLDSAAVSSSLSTRGGALTGSEVQNMLPRQEAAESHKAAEPQREA